MPRLSVTTGSCQFYIVLLASLILPGLPVFAGEQPIPEKAGSLTNEPRGSDTPWASRGYLDQPLSLPDARHLLQRTGFGASMQDLLSLAFFTRQEAIDHVIEGLSVRPKTPMPAWVEQQAPLFWTVNDMSRDDRRQFALDRNAEIVELQQWWVSEMLQTPSPQTERLTLFWHDHFATDYRTINRQSVAMGRQNRTFRELGGGSYRDLLKAMLRDPALLNFLDATSNRVDSPNENLARELLELFTLGEGNYDESTVREAARALTGLGVNPTQNLAFQMDWRRHDADDKTLFGQTGAYDPDGLIDLILNQPASAVHLVNRFWSAFISSGAPEDLTIDALASALRESDFDITALYRAVLQSEAFWAPRHRAALVKSPAQLLIGQARTLEYPACHWRQIPDLLARIGMDLLEPPNVAGWPEGSALVTPGLLLGRQRAAHVLLRQCEEQTGMSASSLSMGDKEMAAPAMGGGMMASGEPIEEGAAASKNTSPVRQPADWRAGSVRLRAASMNEQGGTQNFRITLQNVHVPGLFFNVLDATFVKLAAGRMELRIRSTDCSPECMDPWPECAWRDKVNTGLRAVAFPLLARTSPALPGEVKRKAGAETRVAEKRGTPGKRQQARLWCHYDSVSTEFRELVNVLWSSLPTLVNYVANSPRAKQFAEPFKAWQQQLATQAEELAASPYASTVHELKVDPGLLTSPEASTIIPPPVHSHSLQNTVKALEARSLKLPELLLPGVSADHSPLTVQTAGRPSQAPMKQIRQLVDDPLYQLY